ncbi:hypothetical protein RCL_jg19628.t1 [Rhizophagus clarus]|uniref:Uncharacterized protein n=1 Tax=Rhizophagus clarus TaxID=94130 RepID=A0A8H3QTD9_9GLOM|nr:hypothetical protein RCL_jg19628.t1 [Rhizophagus clarus]
MMGMQSIQILFNTSEMIYLALVNSFRHTRSNDEILTIREKLDHLERYLKILAPHILNITPVSGSNDSAFFKGSNEDDNLDDVFISQDQNCNHI